MREFGGSGIVTGSSIVGSGGEAEGDKSTGVTLLGWSAEGGGGMVAEGGGGVEDESGVDC